MQYSGAVIFDAVKTKIGRNLLVGKRNKCNRNESMVIKDSTMGIKGLGHISRNIIGNKASKQTAKNVKKNLGKY